MNFLYSEYTEVMDITLVIAEKLRVTREERGLTQKALADAIKKTTQTIKDIEKGRRKPSIEVLEDLSEALGVTPSYLLDSGKPAQVKVNPVPVSIFTKRLLAIPDDIYDMASQIPESHSEETWDQVRVVLEHMIEEVEEERRKTKKA